MYVIHSHNEYAFNNPGDCAIYGPYPDLDAAKAGLARLVVLVNDPLFKIDPDPEATDNDGTYAGFYYDDLDKAERNEDIAAEVWAHIVELTAPL